MPVGLCAFRLGGLVAATGRTHGRDSGLEGIVSFMLWGSNVQPPLTLRDGVRDVCMRLNARTLSSFVTVPAVTDLQALHSKRVQFSEGATGSRIRDAWGKVYVSALSCQTYARVAWRRARLSRRGLSHSSLGYHCDTNTEDTACGVQRD